MVALLQGLNNYPPAEELRPVLAVAGSLHLPYRPRDESLTAAVLGSLDRPEGSCP